MDTVARGELVEAELDAMIRRRDEKRRKTEGERDEEALWAASVARHHERERRRNVAAWFAYFCRQADSHRALSEEYERRAEELCEDRGEGGS